MFFVVSKKFDDKYGKKLMDTATKARIDAAKTASKWVVQKTAEATGDLIRNETANKITSLGKTKSKQKKRRWKTRNLHITREKDSKLIMT